MDFFHLVWHVCRCPPCSASLPSYRGSDAGCRVAALATKSLQPMLSYQFVCESEEKERDIGLDSFLQYERWIQDLVICL